MNYHLKTIGHATLLLLENGEPLLATDPWLVGSTYWRSWWLEKYPTDDEIELVKKAREIYITHSHPDHFHLPSLRLLGKPSTLHPKFPGYAVPNFLKNNGYAVRILEPWQWYWLSDQVRIASIPVFCDDSLLIIDTPKTTVVNINDASPRLNLLQVVRDRMLTPEKEIIVLKSYSTASLAQSIFVDGERIPLKAKSEYVKVALRMAESLNANYYVPFASQSFFARRDSCWANEYKVTYEDLHQHWGESKVILCKPFIEMDLNNQTYTSGYSEVNRVLNEQRMGLVVKRELEESSFKVLSTGDFDTKLKNYLDEVYFLRLFFRKGIGWRLSTSNTERFYNSRHRRIEAKIPDDYDFIITIPDKVLYEALGNNILTDLGITQFIKADTKVNPKLTYGAFLLWGMHDYGYFSSMKTFLQAVMYYVPNLIFPRWLMGLRFTSTSPVSLLKPSRNE